MTLNRKLKKALLYSVLLLAIIAGALYLAGLAKENSFIRQIVVEYGYFGIFIISIISGFNLAVPIPAISFLPLFVESGLNFWTSIVLISLGMTIADGVAYFLGKLGWHITRETMERSITSRFEKIKARHTSWPLMLLFVFASLAPFPNEVLVIPMGFLGYKIKTILPIVFAGNFLFNLLYSSGIIKVFNVIAS